MLSAAIFVNPFPGWSSMIPKLAPGAHMVTIMSEAFCMEGRQAGLELRDTLLILSPGPRCRYAFLWRVPTNETAVEQMASTRTGCLNVGACRIATLQGDDIFAKNPHTLGGFGHADAQVYGDSKGAPAYDPGQGRWPPNVLLVHGPACSSMGTRKVKAYSGGVQVTRSSAKDWRHSTKEVHETHHYADENGLETVSSWSCEPGCPVGLLDAQAGQRPSTLTGRADPSQVHENPGDNHGLSLFGGGNSKVYADQGGASRFYPQFADDAEMLEWFKRLVRTKTDA